MKQFPTKIAILGVGLIGGSIALGLKKHFGSQITILGKCNDAKRTRIAKERGIIDVAVDSINSLPRDTKLIIIATPIKTIIDTVKSFAKIPLKNCLIIDVGSTKEVIINAAEKLLPPTISFIGTHPMAGSEMSGFENASVNLFRNKPWIICHDRLPKTQDKLIIKEMIKILGAKEVFMDAKTHDQLTTWASHLFLITSSVLINTVVKQKNWKEIAQITSTGFRDTTRLASDNPKMKTDIVFTNKTNVANVLQSLKNEINIFLQLLEQNNEKEVLRYFKHAKNTRDGWIVNYFS